MKQAKNARRRVARPATSKSKPRKTTKKSAKARGGKTMKAYASFDLYLADQSPAQQRLIWALRELVGRVAPNLVESVKWGNGCWLLGKEPVSYVYAASTYVQLGFIRGSALRDPLGLLEGEGQYVRHIKVRELADIDEAAFGALLRQAIRLASASSS